MRVIGLAGWSGAGKTTLMVKLLPCLIARGRTVSTLKHAHHDGLAYAMCALRMAEYNRRARKDKNKQVFLGGWMNRVSDLMAAI